MTVIAPPAAEPLDDEYDALLGRLAHEPLGDSASLRARLVPELRALLDRGRAEAQARLIADGDGLACARRLSDVMDGAVRLVHDAVVRHLYPADNPSAGEKLAVVATGGYGRGTLAPGSDVDLLFLLPYKQTAWSESVVEAILYVLWDLKLKVGHATRSVDECIREAKADMTIRTALLEARFLFGDRALYDELLARYDRQIVRARPPSSSTPSCASATGASRRPARRATSSSPTSRTAKAGFATSTRCSGSPSTSIASARSGSSSRPACSTRRRRSFSGAATSSCGACAATCTSRPAARRSASASTCSAEIAGRIGMAGRQGLSAVERFMKSYFLIAKDVGDLTAIVCAELEARQAKRRPMLDRMFGRFRRRRAALSRRRTFSSTTTASTCGTRTPSSAIPST